MDLLISKCFPQFWLDEIFITVCDLEEEYNLQTIVRDQKLDVYWAFLSWKAVCLSGLQNLNLNQSTLAVLT